MGMEVTQEMTTIGDSFAIVAILIGIGITAWAMIIGASILFAERSLAARNLTERHPWRSFAVGIGVALTFGLVSVVMSSMPFPAIKLMGVTGLLSLGALSMFGASGLCLSLAGRIRSMEPNVSVYASVVRAASILVIAAFFPMIGWFLIAPIMFVVSLGVGAQALFVRAEAMERL